MMEMLGVGIVLCTPITSNVNWSPTWLGVTLHTHNELLISDYNHGGEYEAHIQILVYND